MTTPPQVIPGRGKAKSTITTPSSAPSTTAATDKKRKENTLRPPKVSKNPNVKLKVVVRGLPPNLPESVFKEATKEWINEITVDWCYYVGGKLYERGNKPNVKSRAYARFKTIEALGSFHKAFNGHIFTDSKGRSSRAMIEFAPYQKYFKSEAKPDPRQGTIESSPEYKEFLESLARVHVLDPVSEQVEEGHNTTPLIEYLRSQKAAKAEKERLNKEKMRNAKLAALQAKADAQTAKIRMEKLAKAEMPSAEQPKDAKVSTSRGGKGGKGSGKAKDAQRSKSTPQPERNLEKTAGQPSTSKQGAGSVPDPSESLAAPSQASASSPPTTRVPDTNLGSPGSRGGRGRGRGRPHGVYRPGGGRGGRRGGGGGHGGPSKPLSNVGEG